MTWGTSTQPILNEWMIWLHPPRSLTASFPLKIDGKGRRSFLFWGDLFSRGYVNFLGCIANHFPCKGLVHHPIETIIYKSMFQVRRYNIMISTVQPDFTNDRHLRKRQSQMSAARKHRPRNSLARHVLQHGVEI